MKRHAEAYQFLRLTWKPKKGDRVEFEGQRWQVGRVVKGKGLALQGREGFLYPGEVLWRPTPQDFNAVLLQTRPLWVYSELFDGNRQLIGFRCNGRIMPLKGKPAQILSQLLSLRAIDSNLNVTINRIFEKSYISRVMKKGKTSEQPRLHLISSQKDSGPT